MTAGLPNDDLRDARAEETDPVWRLLARARTPEPDAWFTVRTLARCRHAGLDAESRRLPAFAHLWRWALGTGLGFCLAIFAMSRIDTESTPETNQKNVQEAFEIMASMGSDSDSGAATTSTPDSNSSWPDSSL
jgi:hypothetical protein